MIFKEFIYAKFTLTFKLVRVSKLPQIDVFFFFFLFISGIEFPENGSIQALHSNSHENAITSKKVKNFLKRKQSTIKSMKIC